MHNCATFPAAVYIDALQGALIGLVSTAMMAYSAPVHHSGDHYRAAWRKINVISGKRILKLFFPNA
jgi:hypothetical protein